MRTDFADRVSVFLDRAAAAGVSHVTYLSAHGTDSAPPETAMRRVELDSAGRASPTPFCGRRGSCRTSARPSSSQPVAPSRFLPAARLSSRWGSPVATDAHLACLHTAICGNRPVLPVSKSLASIHDRPDACSSCSDRRSDDELAAENQRDRLDIQLVHNLS
jgi:hypothetical protein